MPGEFLEIYSYHLLLAALHYCGRFLFCAKPKQYFIIVRQRFGPFPPKYNMSIETLAQNVSYSLRRTALIADRRDQTTKKTLSICRRETEWLWLKGETQRDSRQKGSRLSLQNPNKTKNYVQTKSTNRENIQKCQKQQNCICYCSSSTHQSRAATNQCFYSEPVTWKKSRIRQKWSWSFQPCVSVRGKQHNQYCLTMIMSAVVLPRLKKNLIFEENPSTFRENKRPTCLLEDEPPHISLWQRQKK